jgi:hypothetical protein
MGIEYLVISRMQFELYKQWKDKEKKLEFVWKPKLLTSDEK